MSALTTLSTRKTARDARFVDPLTARAQGYRPVAGPYHIQGPSSYDLARLHGNFLLEDDMVERGRAYRALKLAEFQRDLAQLQLSWMLRVIHDITRAGLQWTQVYDDPSHPGSPTIYARVPRPSSSRKNLTLSLSL